MIARYNNISLLLGVPGLVLQIGGRVATMLPNNSGETQGLGLLAMLVGTALLLAGFAYYAKAKGRHPAWCLMAFLSILGLIVLACLKDKAPGPHSAGRQLVSESAVPRHQSLSARTFLSLNASLPAKVIGPP